MRLLHDPGPDGALLSLPLAKLGVKDLASLTATVNWGDGTISPAELTTAPVPHPHGAGIGPQLASFVANPPHTYWVTGQHRMTITLENQRGATVKSFYGNVEVDSTYLGMGDSYSAGEGAHYAYLAGGLNPVYTDPSGHLDCGTTDTNGSDCDGHTDYCHRALTAYPQLVANSLKADGVSLNFVACSGAVTESIWENDDTAVNSDNYNKEGPQINVVGASDSLITMTFGGNDLHFKDVAEACVSGLKTDVDCVAYDSQEMHKLGYDNNGYFDTTSSAPLSPDGTARSSLLHDDQTLSLHDALVEALRYIKYKAPGARILVLGYPRWFGTNNSNACQDYSTFEQAWLDSRIALVDTVIADAVVESGVAQYVDDYEAFNGHFECPNDPNFTLHIDPSVSATVSGCSAPGSWVNGIQLGPGFFGSPELMHPNPCEHIALADAVLAAYKNDPQRAPFALQNGQIATTVVPAPKGIERIDVIANWTSASVDAQLLQPDGRSAPSGHRISGPTYVSWNIWDPSPGNWRLVVTGEGPDGSIANGSIILGSWAIPLMPPGARVTAEYAGGGDVILTAHPYLRPGDQVQITWFDAGGLPAGVNELGTGTTIELGKQYQQDSIIVETKDDTGYRYSVFNPGSMVYY